MRYTLVSLLSAALLSGCAARTLDDLSSSYERLVNSQAVAHAPPSTRSPMAPAPENLGASFLVVGRSALDAAGGQNVDPFTRIALYRLAAASAHFTLVEEAVTGNPVTVTQAIRIGGTTGATDPGANAAVVMRRARLEGSDLCRGTGQRPPRDCAYLGMAESTALLAVVSEPWIRWKNSDLPAAERVAALRRSPDSTFNPAVLDYRSASQSALPQASASEGAAGSAPVPGSLAAFVRANDVRATCIVSTRAILGRRPEVSDVGDVIDIAALGLAQREMEQWVMDRHRIPPPNCQN
jgi:hypothetical protein